MELHAINRILDKIQSIDSVKLNLIGNKLVVIGDVGYDSTKLLNSLPLNVYVKGRIECDYLDINIKECDYLSLFLFDDTTLLRLPRIKEELFLFSDHPVKLTDTKLINSSIILCNIEYLGDINASAVKLINSRVCGVVKSDNVRVENSYIKEIYNAKYIHMLHCNKVQFSNFVVKNCSEVLVRGYGRFNIEILDCSTVVLDLDTLAASTLKLNDVDYLIVTGRTNALHYLSSDSIYKSLSVID